MADESGIIATELGRSADATNRLTATGFQDIDAPAQWQAPAGQDALILVFQPLWPGGPATEGAPAPTPDDQSAQLHRDLREQWFEIVHVFPKSVAFGFILNDKSAQIEVFNAWRAESRTWLSITNMAGAGVTFSSLPTIPFVFNPLTSDLFNIDVSAEGPPDVFGNVELLFDIVGPDPLSVSVLIALTGQRTVMFVFRPEEPFDEELQFLSDVIRKSGGKEQRAALRKNPRQIFNMLLRKEEASKARQLFDSIVFDLHDQAFGIPVWFEETELTSAVSATDTIINVTQTAFRDFRVGDLAVVLDDVDTFETLQIKTINPTSLEFETAFVNAFAIGLPVYPVRIALLSQTVRGAKYHVNLQDNRFTMRVIDNDANIGSSAAFSSFNSKVLLDDDNLMTSRTLPETLSRKMFELDNRTGIFRQSSGEEVSTRTHDKNFLSQNQQRLWEVRQLLHALKGRVISFYIPTFFEDLSVTQNVTSGSTAIVVTNVGYADFIKSRQPRNVIRLVKTDGTSAIRTVLSASEIDDDEEQLNVDTNWGISATVAEVDRVEFIEKVRFDDDTFQIRHRSAAGRATITSSVRSVLE